MKAKEFAEILLKHPDWDVRSLDRVGGDYLDQSDAPEECDCWRDPRNGAVFELFQNPVANAIAGKCWKVG